MASSLYVHLPFCSSICSYCDFTKLIYKESWVFSYIEEIKKDLKKLGGKKFKTIYLGGGTPTCLPYQMLEDFLKALSPLLEKGGEFSVESTPSSLDEKKLKILINNEVNRLSIGGESSIERIIKEMGRSDSFLALRDAVGLSKKLGLNNINVDMIYAWPNETIDELRQDIMAFLSLDVPHISAYSLILENSTILSARGAKEEDEDKQGEEYELILKSFREAGYDRYEVSNFAKKGFECHHNLTYWKDEEYVGIGLGASGFENGIHYSNAKSLTAFLKGERIVTKDAPSLNDDLETFFLTNLRLEKGFEKEEFLRRFGFSFDSKFSLEAARLIASGLLIETDKRIFPSDKGLLLLDKILVSLIINL